MRRKMILVAVLAIAMTALMGCGGGGNGSGNGSDEVLRTKLAGDGEGLTTKRWRTVALKVNGNYVGTGADQPCPVEVSSKSGIDSTSCDPNEFIELRSDGKSRAYVNGVLEATYDDTWSLSGTTLRTTSVSGSDRVVASFGLTDEGSVAGKQRFRLRTLSETESDGTTLRPSEVGFEFVIEEAP